MQKYTTAREEKLFFTEGEKTNTTHRTSNYMSPEGFAILWLKHKKLLFFVGQFV